jgi:hypothetical protein
LGRHSQQGLALNLVAGVLGKLPALFGLAPILLRNWHKLIFTVYRAGLDPNEQRAIVVLQRRSRRLLEGTKQSSGIKIPLALSLTVWQWLGCTVLRCSSEGEFLEQAP